MDFAKLKALLSDKETDDSVTPSASPLDLIPYTGLASMGADLAGDAIKATPQVLGNEIGSIGTDIAAPTLVDGGGYEAGNLAKAQNVANTVADNGASDAVDVGRATNNLGRAQDFADRARFQRMQRLLGR